jgi:N-acetyl-gamma-glutamyl-phosphate reductase
MHDTHHFCIIGCVIKVAIAGASGYAGQETLDRVLAHPSLELWALGSDSLAGQAADALDPRLGRNGWRSIPRFITNEAALACGADVVFMCLPHEESASLAPPARGVVVDLSGAHRFTNPSVYEAWYGFEHPQPLGLEAWSYGLPEVSPPSGRLISNPGCYATAALLALAPIGAEIEPDGVVVDAMSGMTGAGRALKATSHAGAVLENVAPYRVGEHQHAPEIAELLGFPVTFVPHLLPIRRGLLATCFVRSRGADVRDALESYYEESHVVTVLPEGVAPELARVQQTDGAELGVFEDRMTGTTIVICALDNLGKGAAGQAIQNVNVLYGFEETAGLRLSGVLV